MQNRRLLGVLLGLIIVILCLAKFLPGDQSGLGVDDSLSVESSAGAAVVANLQGPESTAGGTRDLVGAAGESNGEEEEASTGDGEMRGFIVKGRCVHAGSGAPLAACDVRLRREPTATDTRAPWKDLEPTSWVVTGLDGVFELQVEDASIPRRTALRIARDGFAPRLADWKRPKAAEVIDVGDIALDRAVQVTGLVTHPDGQPVADVGILFANIALTGQTLVEPERMLRTRTDGAGRFELDDPAFFGEWYPRVEGSGAMLEPQMVVLGESEYPDYNIHITVEKPDPAYSISGTCVDETGQVMAGVNISAAGGGYRGQGWSREDGTFQVPRGGPAQMRGEVSLSVTDDGRAYEQVLPESGAKFAWGDRDVQCVLRRRPQQVVRVIDGRGESVTRFSLFTFTGLYGGWVRQGRLCFHGDHAGGRVLLKGLPSGKSAVLVVPRAGDLGPSDLTSFDLDAAVPSEDLVITLPDRVTLRVELSDGAGKGVQGSRVELLTRVRGVKPSLNSKAVDIADCDLGSQTPDFARHGAGTSGASGQVEFQTTPGTRYLRIQGQSHIPMVKKVKIEGPLTVLPIKLKAGCSLGGTVGPAPALQTLAQLSPGGKDPVQVELRRKGVGPATSATVQPDGTYSVHGMKPGPYAVTLNYWMQTSTVTEGYIKVPMGEVELAVETEAHLDVDVQPHLPGRLSGRFQVQGQPVDGKHCFAKRSEPKPTQMLRFSTDSEGRFEALVPPGKYTYAITLEAQPGPGWIMMSLPGKWDLAPGAKHKSDYNIQLRTIRARILDQYGAPLANQPIGLKTNGFHSPGTKQTDKAGWITIDPAPLDEFHITTTIDDEKHTLGPVDLPPGQTSGDVTLRIGEVR